MTRPRLCKREEENDTRCQKRPKAEEDWQKASSLFSIQPQPQQLKLGTDCKTTFTSTALSSNDLKYEEVVKKHIIRILCHTKLNEYWSLTSR
jgi:hypothetical protein